MTISNNHQLAMEDNYRHSKFYVPRTVAKIIIEVISAILLTYETHYLLHIYVRKVLYKFFYGKPINF